jgi:AraC-like DNA-binding protein
MILAPISDSRLRATVRRAALPEEDVLFLMEDVQEAMQFAFPRLFMYQTDDLEWIRRAVSSLDPGIPVLALTQPALNRWESAWRVEGLAVRRIDDSALRLRSLIQKAAGSSPWVEGIFADLTQRLGHGLPGELRGFCRRVLEFPSRYSSLSHLSEVVGLSSGALKARFRRRGLPSPSKYLRWFRLAAAARVLADPEETILSASLRMGFNSDGNFCRWVNATSGLSPTALRARGGRMLLLLGMAEECFPEGSLERWGSLGGLFLRDVA